MLKIINQYSLDGILLGSFKDKNEASKLTSIHSDSIMSCCKGKYKTAGGFIFRFEGDNFKLENYSEGDIVCKICNSNETVRSFAGHLRWVHPGIKTEDYVKQYGEFRPKKIKINSTKNQSEFKCELCNEKMMHNRQLMYHITKKHKDVSKEDYIIKYFYNNKVPLCKCGCGDRTELLLHGKDYKDNISYARDYIKGHWDWVKPGYMIHSKITKDLMKEKAKQRIQKEIETQGFASFHNPELLEERRIIRKNNSLDHLESKYEVTIVNREEIEKTSEIGNIFNIKCNKCSNKWVQRSTSFRCGVCDPILIGTSNEEMELINFIKENTDRDLIFHSKNIITPYEFDIYIPSLNLAIEYNGLYWHSELFKDKQYHLNKRRQVGS